MRYRFNNRDPLNGMHLQRSRKAYNLFFLLIDLGSIIQAEYKERSESIRRSLHGVHNIQDILNSYQGPEKISKNLRPESDSPSLKKALINIISYASSSNIGNPDRIRNIEIITLGACPIRRASDPKGIE